MESTHSSVNRSSTSRTADFLVFETVFKMCQDRHLLVNSGRCRKAFNITNVGDPRTWILLYIQSMINVFCNSELLTDVAHMEGAMTIHWNAGVFCTSLAGVIPRFEQETTWFHPPGIANFRSLYLARKNFQVTYDSQDGNVFRLHKPDGSYHEFRDSDRGFYYLNTADNKGTQATVLLQPTLTEGVTSNHTTLVTTVGG